MTQSRSTESEAFGAGLVALRAQGLEPSDYAKQLALDVCEGKISAQQMEDTLLKFYRDKYKVKQ